MASMQVQVQVGDTRRVFFMPQPNSYAELYDAIKKRYSQSPVCNVNEQLILYLFFCIFNKIVLTE